MASSAKSQNKAANWAHVPVMNPAQLGGIETAVLDEGPARGVCIAWVNTGGGLRYKVVIDRGLDIADADFLGQSLTWHSLTGITSPSHAYNRRLEWLRGFYGGLLVSCGPLNTGGPFVEEGEEFSLHGTHSHTRATIESIVQPDHTAGRLEMSITGLVRTARVFGPNVELRRTIRSRLGENTIQVTDEFTNRGNQPVAHAWLLHINFGYPLLEPGASTYCYQGKITPRADSVAWFTTRKDYRAAPAPQESHRGGGEVFTYVDPRPGPKGLVTCGVVNRKRGWGVRLEYDANEFDRLGNWQHWGPGGSYTGALEPMTAGVEGRPVDRQRGWYRELGPGRQTAYHYSITATSDQGELDKLLKLNR